uniref:myoD family inhibitor domain-containing protein-like n=1 Tax=Myxine glutinosa TaxID=7769 RepID=UPI00358FE417
MVKEPPSDPGANGQDPPMVKEPPSDPGANGQDPPMVKEPPSDPGANGQDPPASRSLDPPASRSFDPPASQSFDPHASRSLDPPASQSLDPPASRSLDPPASQSLDPPASQSLDPPASRSLDPPASRSLDPPASRSLDPPASRSLDPLSLALHGDVGPIIEEIEEIESNESRQPESGPVVTQQPLQSEDQEDLKPDALDVTPVACGMNESQMLINEQCSNGWPNKDYGPSQENQDHNKGERHAKRSKSSSKHNGVRAPSSKHIDRKNRSAEAVSRGKGSTNDAAAMSQVPIEAADGCCINCVLACLFCEFLTMCSVICSCMTCGLDDCCTDCLQDCALDVCCGEDGEGLCGDCELATECCSSSECFEICCGFCAL